MNTPLENDPVQAMALIGADPLAHQAAQSPSEAMSQAMMQQAVEQAMQHPQMKRAMRANQAKADKQAWRNRGTPKKDPPARQRNAKTADLPKVGHPRAKVLRQNTKPGFVPLGTKVTKLFLEREQANEQAGT